MRRHCECRDTKVWHNQIKVVTIAVNIFLSLGLSLGCVLNIQFFLGTNLQALIDYTQNESNQSKAEIVLVLSNVPDVEGLKRAERSNIPTKVSFYA